MPLNNWLLASTKRLLQAGIESARLDALILLSDELERNKAWILAHPEHNLTATNQIRLAKNIARRQKCEPLAYIRGWQEFYGRDFLTTNKVLVPRPEAEAMIGLLLTLPSSVGDKLIDVGTGSGIIAISAKLEMPDLTVYATDISKHALQIAATNARHLKSEVTFKHADLLNNVNNGPFKFIAANLPYVARHWQTSPELDFEPPNAIFADDNGLSLIKRLLGQAKKQLIPGGYLLIEADPRQHSEIIRYAKANDYKLHNQQDFILTFYCEGGGRVEPAGIVG